MFDIHSHVLYDVDDGAATLDESLIMLNLAVEQGIHSVFATPHSESFLCDRELALEHFQILKSHALPSMQLYLGCEVCCDKADPKEILRALERGTLPTMNGTKFVLTEFPHFGNIDCAYRAVRGLIKGGWVPIIAHAERYSFLTEEDLLRFCDMGALLQVNAYSLGFEYDPIRQKARQLAQRRCISFLGTDMHNTYSRPPCVTAGLNWLWENLDKHYVNLISDKNASDLLLPHKHGIFR